MYSVWNSVIYVVLESSDFLYFLIVKKKETTEAEWYSVIVCMCTSVLYSISF